AEDLVARPKPRYARTDGLNLSREIRAANAILWLAHPVHRAGDVRQAAHDRPITRVDAGRPNSHEYITLPDLGCGDVAKFQHLGAAVPVLNDRLHRGCPCRRCANLG